MKMLYEVLVHGVSVGHVWAGWADGSETPVEGDGVRLLLATELVSDGSPRVFRVRTWEN